MSRRPRGKSEKTAFGLHQFWAIHKIATTMNRFEKFFGLRSEAKVRFLDGEFQVLNAGDFVRCAVTGQTITLDELRYWDVDRQEAYASAEISFKRYLELRKAQRR